MELSHLTVDLVNSSVLCCK